MGRFFLKILVYMIFGLLMIVDFFIISDLISTLIRTDTFISTAMTFGFIAGMDIVPIFALTPLLNKRMKGLTDKSAVENFLIWTPILIFIILESAYFFLSISYPERFFVGDHSTITEAERSNLAIVSIITGLLPLATTLISLLMNFLLIGNEYVEKEILKCDQAIEELYETNSKFESENILLDNLSDCVGLIQNHINNYKNNIESYIDESVKKEQEQKELANVKIEEHCWKEFNEFIIIGDNRLLTNGILSSPNGRSRYSKWQQFINESRLLIENKINIANNL